MAETTTQKARNFVADRLRDKPITDVPGIGKAIGDVFIEAGYSKAYHLLGEYLVHNKDKDLFVATMLTKNPKFTKRYSDQAVAALELWCESNL